MTQRSRHGVNTVSPDSPALAYCPTCILLVLSVTVSYANRVLVL